MSKLNVKTSKQSRATSPVVSTPASGAVTYEGHPAYERDTKSELFLLGVTNFVGEDTFYEQATDRDRRFAALARTVAVEDIDWLTNYVRWLRTEAKMRSASVVAAAEGVKARLAGPLAGKNRQLINAALQRADEPGEFLGYWTGKWGNDLPMPVKRGVADAAIRMYTERNFVKWDSDRRGWRFGDVIAMTRPRPKAEWQDLLFEYILADRHNRAGEIPLTLSTLVARQSLLATPVEQRRELLASRSTVHQLFGDAGMTWEALSGWIQGPMDAQAWEAIIPEMGVFALIRNLRNFDEQKIGDEAAAQVIAKITSEEDVAKSRILPMRVLSAYNAAPSDRWKHPLATTVDFTTGNIPELPGRTLILVDTSGSMGAPFSKDGSLMRWDSAALFGLVLAKRNEGRADLVAFSSATMPFTLRRGASVLGELQRWQREGYFMGGGTQTAAAIQRHYAGHDRVMILTDEQAHYSYSGRTVTDMVPARVPMYTWNLAGYQHGSAPSGTGNRHTFGGLNDQAFSTVPMLEAAQNAVWPWEKED